AFAGRPVPQLDGGDDLRTAGARQRNQVAGVIVVAVSDEDEIEGAELLGRFRAGGIAGDPRIQDDPLAAGRDEEERAVTEPGERERRHRRNLSPKSKIERPFKLV